MGESFLHYFNRTVSKVRVVRKTSSSFMQALAGFMDIAVAFRASNINRERFLTEFTTTIGDTIYSNRILMDSEPTPIIVHELCHVLQFKKSSMPWEFLFRPSRRMFYESECVEAEILCFPNLRRGNEWFERHVEQFKDYGIKESIVRRELQARLDEIQRGEFLARPLRVSLAYSAWQVQEAGEDDIG